MTAKSKRAWVIAGTIAGALTVGSVAVASQARTPGEIAARANPPSPSVITVQVVRDTLVRTVRATCDLQARSTVALKSGSGSAGDTPLVTGLPVEDGGTVEAARVALEVSGRPMIVLQGALPVFRDMRPGTSGPDVRQLQEALAAKGWLGKSAISGKYGRSTGRAVERMYASLGYSAAWTSPQARSMLRAGEIGVSEARGGQDAVALKHAEAELSDLQQQEGVVVPRTEVVFVPATPATLRLGQLSLGSAIGDDPGAVLSSGEMVFVCPLADVDPELVTPGSAVRLENHPDELAVLEIRSTTDGAGNDGSKGPIPVAVIGAPDGLAENYSATPASVRIQIAKAPAEALVVPVSALWERPGGTVVVERTNADGTSDVPVTVTFEANGLAAIQPADGAALAEGDNVKIGSGS